MTIITGYRWFELSSYQMLWLTRTDLLEFVLLYTHDSHSKGCKIRMAFRAAFCVAFAEYLVYRKLQLECILYRRVPKNLLFAFCALVTCGS